MYPVTPLQELLELGTSLPDLCVIAPSGPGAAVAVQCLTPVVAPSVLTSVVWLEERVTGDTNVVNLPPSFS